MNSKSEGIAAIYEDVKKAGRAVGTEWPGVIDADDAEQEIWVKLLSSEKYVEQVNEMSQKERNRALRLIGHQVASQYRADYEVFTGQVYYSTKDVRALLEDGILTKDLEEIGAGTETMTEYLDVFEGMALLLTKNLRHADLLNEKYFFGKVTTDYKGLERAADKLTGLMNQVHKRRRYEYSEGIGTRKVVTNENARYISDHQDA